MIQTNKFPANDASNPLHSGMPDRSDEDQSDENPLDDPRKHPSRLLDRTGGKGGNPWNLAQPNTSRGHRYDPNQMSRDSPYKTPKRGDIGIQSLDEKGKE